MSELITAELVDLDLSAATKDAAARSLAERMVAAHRVTDLAQAGRVAPRVDRVADDREHAALPVGELGAAVAVRHLVDGCHGPSPSPLAARSWPSGQVRGSVSGRWLCS